MLPNKKKIRSNNIQLQMLVDYMAAHKKFANGEYTGLQGQQKMQQQWEKVRVILADHGPDKSIDQWKHTWRDLKRRCREEGARVLKARESTGNAEFVPVLSDLSSKVLGVLEIECPVGIGDPGETSVGLPTPHSTLTHPAASASNGDSVDEAESWVRLPQRARRAAPPPPPQAPPPPAPAQQQPRTRRVAAAAAAAPPAPPAGRDDDALAPATDSNYILRDILDIMKARHLQSRMQYRQMLRTSRSIHFKF